MKFNSLRKTALTAIASLGMAGLLVSCGGGGSPEQQQTGGPMQILPATGSMFAGVPFQISISGGQKPYVLTSSEPSLVPVPTTTTNNFVTLLAANTGVIDSDLKPEDLPIRSVNIDARGANGFSFQATYRVAQNFLTGYGVSLVSTCQAATSGGTAPQACGGGETVVSFTPVVNGNRYGARQYRFEVIRGPFSWVANPSGPIIGNTVTVTTDHTGKAVAIFRVNNGVPSQLAILRITDVATGVYTDTVFNIAAGTPGTLSAIPNQFTFTGALTTDCGVGQADFFVFDGTPPYTAISSDPDIFVSPSSNTQPGQFTLRAINSGKCTTGSTIIVQDAAGARTTVTVTTAAGSGAPPTPTPLTVSPTSLTLTCGTGGSATVIGGVGAYSVTSSHPRVTAVLAGGTVTVNRLTGDGATLFNTSATINVTDGATIGTIAVTVPANCP